MPTIINGDSPSITFSDTTTQTTAFTTNPTVNNIKSQAATPLTFAINATEAMRIDSSGNLFIGATTNVTGSSKLFIKNAAGNTNNPLIQLQAQASTSATTMLGFYDDVGTFQGQVYIDPVTNTTSFSTSSDYRLKDNVAPMSGALDKVSALKPVTYQWKKSGKASQGFIAHELQSVIPEAVIGEKDGVNEDGKIAPQMIDTSFLVATLTAAIQEQQAMIETLTTRLTALESK